MKVSIITATYNSNKFLETCICSVMAQDYPDIEYILIDGGSTDSTQSIINKYSNNIVKWISEPDTGIYDAINKGIKLASGDIVGVLNSDDFFSDDSVISRIVKSFKDDEALEIVYADVSFVVRENINKSVRHYSSRYFRPYMFKFGFQPAHPSLYVKRGLFEKFGYYRTDLKIAGDFELLLRFLLKNKLSYKYISDVWVKMRIGGVSTSGIKSILQINNEIIKAHKINGIYTNIIFTYSKYIVKWWGFLRK